MKEETIEALSALPEWSMELPNEWRFACPCCEDEAWLERNAKLNMIGCFSGCHPALICYQANITLSDVFIQGNRLARDVFYGLVRTAIADGVRISQEDRQAYMQAAKRLSYRESA